MWGCNADHALGKFTVNIENGEMIKLLPFFVLCELKGNDWIYRCIGSLFNPEKIISAVCPKELVPRWETGKTGKLRSQVFLIEKDDYCISP